MEFMDQRSVLESVGQKTVITDTEFSSSNEQLTKRLAEDNNIMAESNAEKIKLAERLAESKSEKNKLTKRLHDANKRLDESNAEKVKLAERLAESKSEKNKLTKRLHDANKRLDESNAEKVKLAERLAESKSEKNKLTERLHDANERVDESNAEKVKLAERLAESESEKNKLTKRLHEANKRLGESNAEKVKLDERLAEANYRLDERAAVKEKLPSKLLKKSEFRLLDSEDFFGMGSKTSVTMKLTPGTATLLPIRANKPSTVVDKHAIAATSAGKIWTAATAMEAPPNKSKSPTLKHVIPSDGRRVVGLTFINNELFVLRDPSKEEIQVYETATFTQQRTVRVTGLSDDGSSWYKTLTSCDVNNCLFVCDYRNVYKVDLSTNNVINWQVDGGPTGLSVNDARHVIVTCHWSNEIREYEQTGQLIRTIKLQESHVTRPCHAVQLNKSMFIVSHHGPVHGVSLIDTQGRVTATYRNSDSTKMLNYPRQLTVGKNGSVLVVDCDNNRLVVLDASLKNARELTLPIDGGLNGPGCLYFNKSLGQLFVGELGGERVVICDDNYQP